MMIRNLNLILYACVAKGATILTEFPSSSPAEMQSTIAQKCIERTPPHHSIFSHTVRNKTYTFLIENTFAYFAISHEDLPKSDCLSFLNALHNAFQEFLASNPINQNQSDDRHLASLCFQSHFHPIFSHILGSNIDLHNSSSSKGSRNPSMDSDKGHATVAKPLLSKPPTTTTMKKKKKSLLGLGGGGGMELNVDHRHLKGDDGIAFDAKLNNNEGENGNLVTSREFSVSVLQKTGGFYMGHSRHKAKQIWRKHVWVVLILDLFVCAVLFGIWLWVCRGFQCIDG